MIVVDPPRRGLDESVISHAAGMQPERIVYVSCDPGTLARDLASFARQGYTPAAGVAVDMFPRTSHVETVVLLSKGEIDSNMYQRSELDYLICNDPMGYADLVLNGNPETYLKTVTEYKPLDS